jgi:hypothetical protein
VYDQEGNLVALLAEDEGSIGRAVGRQLLRTRRPFSATVLSPDGQVIFRMRRPFYLINSTMYIEVRLCITHAVQLRSCCATVVRLVAGQSNLGLCSNLVLCGGVA